MTEGPRVYVAVAVEGESDTGMVQTLLRHVRLTLSRPCLVKRGVANLDKTIHGLSRTKIDNPWIVFRDSDGRCPVELRRLSSVINFMKAGSSCVWRAR